MHRWILLRKYLSYWWNAGNRHHVHSPFVYKLLTETIKGKKRPANFQEIEALRKELSRSTERIQITDFGAGSRINRSKERAVSDITKHSAKNTKYGNLLFRLVDRFQPKTILELGTSLGFSTVYLSAAQPEAQVTTLEGCPETARLANANFQKLSLQRIQLECGPFFETLEPALKQLGQVDFVFIDGNHQEEPTIAYFEACLPYLHAESVLVFDDIHWSDGMERAWEHIKSHPQVSVTVDLFFVGLVFLRSGQEEEHFQLRF